MTRYLAHVQRAAHAHRVTGRRDQLAGAIRLALDHGARWADVSRAAGYSVAKLRRLTA